MTGEKIDTVIAPMDMWHVRKHVIRADMPIEIAEDAFPENIPQEVTALAQSLSGGA